MHTSAKESFAVVVEWGLFSWSLAAKLRTWSAVELLIAGAIGRWLYLRMGA